MFRWRKWSLIVGTLCLAGVLLQACFVINTTPSFPPGVYLKTYQQVEKGSLVLLCPPQWPIFREALKRHFLAAGLCPSGTGYIIKQVMGNTGDAVEITPKQVSINGETLPHSSQVITLEYGIGHISSTLQENEVLLMSPHPLSFDARYFGPMDNKSIITTLTPIVIWE